MWVEMPLYGDATALRSATAGLLIVRAEWPTAFSIAAIAAGFIFSWLVMRLVGLASRRWRKGSAGQDQG